jgi:CDGSH-type Zn-finger protein
VKKDKPKIACLPNGPYYLLNDLTAKVIPNIQSSKGEPRSTISGVALCRCGGSNNKPFCDGTHGKIGFTDAKLTDGALNKRVNYAGKGVAIHDNRGICAHAGFCTDRLASVFKLKEEPWIEPDGATVQEVVDAVERCPSGALSCTVNNDKKERSAPAREPMVTVTKNGPYAIRGDIELIDQPRGEGASTEHYTLCRCGGSKNKPFCDGTHWHIGFKDEKN